MDPQAPASSADAEPQKMDEPLGAGDEDVFEKAPPFDWVFLCMPRLPCFSKPTKNPPFFKINMLLPWHVATVMGFQHALAMLGGIIAVPLIVGGPFDANLTNEESQYLISAGLIASGILSFVQIYRLKLGNSGYYMGTGLVTVLGTSFTFVPVLQASVFYMMQEASDRPCKVKDDCHYSSKQCIPDASSPLGGFCSYSGREAYGAYLGTGAVCALIEVLLAFMPRPYLRRCFPPIVTGVCVICIGVMLTATGLKYWGGGAFCADHYYKRYTMIKGVDVPGDVVATYDTQSPCKGGACVPNKGSLSGVCEYTAPSYDEKANKTIGDITQCVRFKDTPGPFPAQENVQMSWVMCGDNGEVFLPFGAAEYVGLGFSVFAFLVITEMFGSPFVRNCQVAIALLAGFAVSAVASYNVPGSDKVLRYTNSDKISNAPGITFLWVETFPLSIYVPAVIPTLIAYVVSTVETVGDIVATAEASRVHQDGQLDSRIQGGLLADGICSIIACLMTSPPNTTFSQNNGVVALTRCANRRAGYCCCFFLIIFGVIAKISAIINTIPYSVLGGMTTFLFVNIVVSGIGIIGPELHVRRSRFIVAASLTFGIGVALVPQWADNDLVRASGNKDYQFMGRAVVILLNTPYCIGTIVAMFLHAIIPFDEDESVEEEEAAAAAASAKAKALDDINGPSSIPCAPLVMPLPSLESQPMTFNQPMLMGGYNYGGRVGGFGGYPPQGMQGGSNFA